LCLLDSIFRTLTPTQGRRVIIRASILESAGNGSAYYSSNAIRLRQVQGDDKRDIIFCEQLARLSARSD